ncbi:MAG: DUF3524 domain-containing protein [Bacteroidia bacterium]|nr:DUF3524 domain-containing protein [Bacteroidia bacterium]
MKILLLEPFFTGSHANWARGVAKHSGHEVKILSLSGKYWKWRMHGGAHSLAVQYLESDFKADLILATDMLDVGLFVALARKKVKDTPVALYFHENQLVYPWSPDDADVSLKRDRHYAFINFSSARVADRVFFNSRYHLEAFFEALPSFLKAFPDQRQLEAIEEIRRKSEVLELGLNLGFFDSFRPGKKVKNKVPVILWNHRWEYDKDPDSFFETLFHLKKEGQEFKLIVAGEAYKRQLPIFDRARKELKEEIVHWGFVENREAYAKLLFQSDIIAVTSLHDFFGVSVVEAIYCGLYPILPQRLAYPEHIPAEFHPTYLYQSKEDLFQKLSTLLENPAQIEVEVFLQRVVGRYDWSQISSIYFRVLAGI